MREIPRSAEDAVSFALGIAPPFGSVTMPVNSPELTWAEVLAIAIAIKNATWSFRMPGIDHTASPLAYQSGISAPPARNGIYAGRDALAKPPASPCFMTCGQNRVGQAIRLPGGPRSHELPIKMPVKNTSAPPIPTCRAAESGG